MIRRPIKEPVPAASPAQRLAREKSDFTAEGAPAPDAPPPAATPPAPPQRAALPRQHGPARRKRW